MVSKVKYLLFSDRSYTATFGDDVKKKHDKKAVKICPQIFIFRAFKSTNACFIEK